MMCAVMQETAEEADAEAGSGGDASPLRRIATKRVSRLHRHRGHARLHGRDSHARIIHFRHAARPDIARDGSQFFFPGAVFRSRLDFHDFPPWTALICIASEVPRRGRARQNTPWPFVRNHVRIDLAEVLALHSKSTWNRRRMATR